MKTKKAEVEMVALIILTLFHIIQLSQTNSIVETDVGTIRGLKSSDGDYNMYMGIPYADVDINNPFGVSRTRTFIFLT